jgi:hypothetical protein
MNLYDFEGDWDEVDERNRLRVSVELEDDVSPGLWEFVLAKRDGTFVSESEIFEDDLKNTKRLMGAFRSREHARTEVDRRADDRKVSLDTPWDDRPQPQDSERRSEALSYLAALDAWIEPEVQRFRDEHLDDNLMDPSEVELWIRAQADVDAVGHTERSSLWLYWQQPKAQSISSLRVQVGGILESLARIGEALRRPYWWRPSQTTMFVLTGSPPYIPAIAAEITRDQRHPSLRRMILEVDLAVTPSQLARKYRVHRALHMRGSRVRAMKPKQIRLAAFTANKGTVSWSTLMSQWNQRWPGHRYQGNDVKNFARDARRARRLLLNTPELLDVKEVTDG